MIKKEINKWLINWIIMLRFKYINIINWIRISISKNKWLYKIKKVFMQCNILKNIIYNIKIIKNIFKNNINDIINDFLANLNWTPYINLNLNLYIT